MADATIPLILALLAVGIAVLNFWRALNGYRSGRASVEVPSISLDADREDDPVGFSTAVWGNVAMGLIALAFAAGVLWIRPSRPDLTAADIERAPLCSASDAARPVRHVRNVRCQAGTSGTRSCDYEAASEAEPGMFVPMLGVLGWDRRTASWCFSGPPETSGAPR